MKHLQNYYSNQILLVSLFNLIQSKEYKINIFLVINPIVPNDIAFKDEFMSDSENESLEDDE